MYIELIGFQIGDQFARVDRDVRICQGARIESLTLSSAKEAFLSLAYVQYTLLLEFLRRLRSQG